MVGGRASRAAPSSMTFVRETKSGRIKSTSPEKDADGAASLPPRRRRGRRGVAFPDFRRRGSARAEVEEHEGERERLEAITVGNRLLPAEELHCDGQRDGDEGDNRL